MADMESPENGTRGEDGLMRVAHMFLEYRDDPIMRELCRLAVKCAQERKITQPERRA